MFTCALPGCDKTFDPTKDFFVTVNERKGPALNFDSMECAQTYVDDED